MGSRIQRRQVGSEPSRTLGRVAPEVEASITSARGLGKGLEPSLQSKLEHGFNRDLSGVRVHTGPRADRLNHALYARAFTVGNDMFFRGGMFRPNSRSGQELIAHEVTHTLQQTSGPPVIQRFIYGGDDPHDLKQRKDPKHVYTLLVGTYGMDPLSAKNLIKTYGDVNRGPSIRLADLIRAYRKPKSKEEIEVKSSEKKKRRKPRRKKSKLELGHKDKQLKKKLPSKLEEPKEKEKEEDKLVSEPPKHKKPKLPTRNEVIEALKTGKPLSTSSENAKNLFSIQVRGANFVVKYEKKFGGLREALPAILAKEFGLGDYYVDSVSYVAPDNERDMVVMPFVTAKTGLGPNMYEKHTIKPQSHLEIILFEWLIGSTDRHASNVMFTGEKQPWKLFDHGASFGVGARGNRASGKPHMRLGALNVLFESYIANKLPDLTSTQIKQSYGQVRPIVPESYGLLYIGEQTLEKIIKMGDTVLIRLDEATAPKSYTQYISSGLGHLKRLRKLGADKASFADLIAAPKQKKKEVKKRKKRKKPKKKAIKPAPKSTEPKVDKPELKSKSIVRKTKNLTVNTLFSELKDLYIQKNRSYPFANSKEASVVYENLVEHVKERTDFKATALEMRFETWIAHLDLNSDETAENQAKALYLKIKEAYQNLYGVDLSGEEKTVKALTVEALVEGPQGVDVKLESVESEKAYEFAYYIRERLTKLGINLLAPVQKKKVKQKKHRALTVGRAKVLLRKSHTQAFVNKWSAFQKWLECQDIQFLKPKEKAEVNKRSFGDLTPDELQDYATQYTKIMKELEQSRKQQAKQKQATELKRRKELAENVKPEQFASEFESGIDKKDPKVLSKLAELLSLWAHEKRLVFMNKLAKEYHAVALTAGFGPLGEQGLEYGKAIQFHNGIPKDIGDNFKRPMYKWLFNEGPEPKTMNCWEAVLFAGYRIGLLTKEQVKLLDIPDEETSTPEVVRRVQASRTGEIVASSQQAFLKKYNAKPPRFP